MAFSKRAPRAGAFSKVAAESEPVAPAAPPQVYHPSAAENAPAQQLRGGDDGEDEWWRSSSKKKEEAESRERQAEVAQRNREWAAKSGADREESGASRAEDSMRARRERQAAAISRSKGGGKAGAGGGGKGGAGAPGRGFGGCASSDLEARLGVGLPSRSGPRSTGGTPGGGGAPGFSRASGAYGGFTGFGGNTAAGMRANPGAAAAKQREETIGKLVAVVDYGMKPELNGQFGTVEAYEELAGQWRVKLESGDTVKLRDKQMAIVKFTDEPGDAESAALPTNLECYAGHYLREEEAEAEEEDECYTSCDVCNADVAPKEKFLYCEGCDYAMCKNCSAKEVRKIRGPPRD